MFIIIRRAILLPKARKGFMIIFRQSEANLREWKPWILKMIKIVNTILRKRRMYYIMATNDLIGKICVVLPNHIKVIIIINY